MELSLHDTIRVHKVTLQGRQFVDPKSGYIKLYNLERDQSGTERIDRDVTISKYK